MSTPLSDEQLAAIRRRAHASAQVTWRGGPDEKYWALNDREELLAEVVRLRAAEKRVLAFLDEADRENLNGFSRMIDGKPFATRVGVAEVRAALGGSA
jgi:hypothetical protein